MHNLFSLLHGAHQSSVQCSLSVIMVNYTCTQAKIRNPIFSCYNFLSLSKTRKLISMYQVSTSACKGNNQDVLCNRSTHALHLKTTMATLLKGILKGASHVTTKVRENEKSSCGTMFNQLMLISTSRRTQAEKEEIHQESGAALGQVTPRCGGASSHGGFQDSARQSQDWLLI